MAKRIYGKTLAECEDNLCERLLSRVSDRTPDFIERKSEHFIPVMVYGTLKTGGYFHDTLKGCPFLGDAVTANAAYTMSDTGSFPVVFHITNAHDKRITQRGKVYGEVYVVDPLTLLQLDRIENNGVMYTRKEISVKLLDQSGPNQYLKVWMYVGVDRYWSDERYLQNVPMTVSSLGCVYEWKSKKSLDDVIPF